MTPNRHFLGIVIACLASAASAGCVAPGSSVTQVEFRGRMLDPAGEPMAHRAVKVCLPAGYGLRGLDAAWGKPADYGHRDQWAWVTTEAHASFAHRFKPVSYSVLFWLLPPLGAGRPPKPVVGLRSRLASGEWFLVYVDGDESRAVRFREATDGRAPVPGAAAKPVVTFRKRADGSPAGWTSDVTITRPAG